ncbi:hypothetical protein ACFOET_11235 [Parapedobacter deserti]|uniref:WD40 repeat domain-containing protein n=1 Tax=Parapedobacter deserti TaxID=1912957 RepID=A0ABV7JJA0_9SPHI
MARVQKLKSIWLLCLLVGLLSQGYAQTNSKTVIRVDTEFPTQDKPQSKLWYMHETWWAMLPTTSGPSIWKRLGEEKWALQDDITKQLKGMPSRADVQVEGTSIYAVVVDDARLSVLEIDAKEQENWALRSAVNLETSSDATIETATIAHSSNGALWVVADNGDRVVLWHRSEDKFWSEPYVLASGISADDIATVTATSQEVHAIWSNQNLGFFETRTHVIGDHVKQWSAPKVLGKEKQIADDHINIKTNQRDDVWMVTKNSHDGHGTNVFELWRKKEGEHEWQYRSFAPLTPEIHPSRPAVILTDYPDIAFVGYTVYSQDRNKGIVQFSTVDVENLSVGAPKIGIYSNEYMINDLTTAKQQYLASAQAWIALASDKEGNVYEVDLRALLLQNSKWFSKH